MKQYCVVWHSSLTNVDSNNLERFQNWATRILLLKEEYNTYEDALKTLEIKSLYERRLVLCERIAKNTTEYDKLKLMFPKKETETNMEIRNTEQYEINLANTKTQKFFNPIYSKTSKWNNYVMINQS